MAVIDDIINQDLGEYDALPVSAKLLLATRLLSSIGTDMVGFRSRFWHDSIVRNDLHQTSRHGLLGDSAAI